MWSLGLFQTTTDGFGGEKLHKKETETRNDRHWSSTYEEPAIWAMKKKTVNLHTTNKQQVSYVASRASRPPADGLDLHDNTTAEIIQEGIY